MPKEFNTLNASRGTSFFEKGAFRNESFQQLCARHSSIPADKLDGLFVHTVPFAIGKTAYLALHDYLTGFYNERIVSLKKESEQDATREFLQSAPSSPGLNILAYKAYLLFGSVKKLQDFTTRCDREKIRPHSCVVYLESITFPPDAVWDQIDFRAWGDAFVQEGYDRTNPHFQSIAHEISPKRSNGGHISLRRTLFNSLAQKMPEPLSPLRLAKLIDLAVEFNKQVTEFKRTLEYSAQEPPKKPAYMPVRKMLPDIFIAGNRFGMPGTTFRKLSGDDPRLLFLGDYTNCCERVTDKEGSLERAISQAVTAQDNAYYIVERGPDILCSSWAWRGTDGEFVFDGFESKVENFNLHNLDDLLESFVEEVRKPHHRQYGFNGVLLGTCAEHLTFEHKFENIYRADDIMPKDIKGIGMDQEKLKIIAPLRYPGAWHKRVITPPS